MDRAFIVSLASLCVIVLCFVTMVGASCYATAVDFTMMWMLSVVATFKATHIADRFYEWQNPPYSEILRGTTAGVSSSAMC